MISRRLITCECKPCFNAIPTAVSKTIRLPSAAAQGKLASALVLAHEQGCKGLTEYRSGSRKYQVLPALMCNPAEDSRSNTRLISLDKLTGPGVGDKYFPGIRMRQMIAIGRCQMFAVAGGPSVAGNPLSWNLLFARQPEPDLEFTEEELEQTTNVRSSSPLKPPKKSGGRPLLWIVLLLLVGGGTYVAMDPELVTDLIGPLLGDSPAPPAQPPVAMKPPRPMPAPGTPAGQTDASSPAPVPPSIPMPQATAPGGPPTPPPSSDMPGSPPAAQPAPATPALPNPAFGEGQKVMVMLSPATPGDSVMLMQDAAGTKPGPTVRPGTTLIILDGDLQSSGWVYSVRSDEGAKGWIAENRLRLKP
jgi:hypothetical protein